MGKNVRAPSAVAARDGSPARLIMSLQSELSIVFLAQNEHTNLTRTLAPAVDWGCPTYVLDGGSSDGTKDLARSAGAIVLERPFDHWALQRNWVLNEAQLETEWVLFLDADELVTPQLRAVVETAIQAPAINAYYLNRMFVFLGRELRHSGLHPNWVLRLVRRGTTQWRVDNIREFAVVDGPVGHLEGAYVRHEDHRGLLFWCSKHIWLAAMEAAKQHERSSTFSPQARDAGGQAQVQEASFRRRVRDRVFRRLPWILPPAGLFAYRYFVKQGFRDGSAGFVYSFLRELWFPIVAHGATVETADPQAASLLADNLRHAAFADWW
jgi:hypothetical protein